MVYRKTFTPLVTNGPSKMDLMTALAYAFDKSHKPFTVTFYLRNHGEDAKTLLWRKLSCKGGTPFEAKITSVQHEDGSGESFMIAGMIDPSSIKAYSDSCAVNFEGYYSTKTRSGNLTFDVDFVDDGKGEK